MIVNEQQDSCPPSRALSDCSVSLSSASYETAAVCPMEKSTLVMSAASSAASSPPSSAMVAGGGGSSSSVVSDDDDTYACDTTQQSWTSATVAENSDQTTQVVTPSSTSRSSTLSMDAKEEREILEVAIQELRDELEKLALIEVMSPPASAEDIPLGKDQLVQEIAKLARENHALKRTIYNIPRRVRSDIEGTRKENKFLKKKVEGLRHELVTVEKDRDDLRYRVNSVDPAAEEKLKESEEQCDKLQYEVDRMRSELELAQKMADMVQSEIDELYPEVQDLRNLVHEQNDELESLRGPTYPTDESLPMWKGHHMGRSSSIRGLQRQNSTPNCDGGVEDNLRHQRKKERRESRSSRKAPGECRILPPMPNFKKLSSFRRPSDGSSSQSHLETPKGTSDLC